MAGEQTRKPKIARQARLTEASYEAWERYVTRRGVSWTALIEALGEQLAAGENWVPETAVVRARQLDRQRGSRRERG